MTDGDTHQAPLREAASLILVDRSPDAPKRVLMGKRRHDQVFLPGKWVFPGGRVEQGDGEIVPASPLNPSDQFALAASVTLGAPERFATAAVRELYEETGYGIGEAQYLRRPTLPGDLIPQVWQNFVNEIGRPALSGLRYVARAITPPFQPRRFDTCFFLADSTTVTANAGVTDEEFETVLWATYAEAAELDLARITRLVLAEVVNLTKDLQSPADSVPFFVFANGAFERRLINRAPLGSGSV